MYSHEYKKAVFIDFGLSELVQKGVGKKTMTKYNGTALYSSSQMLKLFKGKWGLVDLYMNDIFGLKKTFIIKRQANTK